jgi:hypothetical protein
MAPPKPQFLQMAAAQMMSEGKFGQVPQGGGAADKYASMQPASPIEGPPA